MNIESFRSYCLTKRGATEAFPFDNNTLVFKVMDKIFALTSLTEFDGVNLKVDPEHGAELRERYDFVQPAYHMNKKHWITVKTGGGITDAMFRALIDDSYNLVASKLTKSQKLSLNML